MRTNFVIPARRRGISPAAAAAVTVGYISFVLHVGGVEAARRRAEVSVLADVATALRLPYIDKEQMVALLSQREQDALRGRYARVHGLLGPDIEAKVRAAERLLPLEVAPGVHPVEQDDMPAARAGRSQETSESTTLESSSPRPTSAVTTAY